MVDSVLVGAVLRHKARGSITSFDASAHYRGTECCGQDGGPPE